MSPDNLRLATEAYYWKPAKAMFTAFDLEQWARADLSGAKHPVLDLGCGDGTFSALLRAGGMLDAVDIGLDYARQPLERAHHQTMWGVIQADARALPFREGSIASVLANAALAAIPADVERAFCEISRVLMDEGLAVLTVPTKRFEEMLWFPKLFRAFGARDLAQLVTGRKLRRLEHHTVMDESGWCQQLEATQLRVTRVCHYFTRRQAFWFRLLTVRPMRVVAIVKILRRPWLAQKVARLEERLFSRLFTRQANMSEADKRSQASTLLIIAKKRPVNLL